MLVEHGLELLEEDECRRLLEANDFGRVAVTVGALPAIFPVNYRFIDGAVVFLSGEGTKLWAALRGAVVAFEVDHREPADRTGWSVLAVGRAVVADDTDTALDVVEWGPVPYVRTGRLSIIRIEPAFLSGRRIVEPSTAGWSQERDATIIPAARRRA